MIDYLVDGEGHRVWKQKNGIKVQGFLYRSELQPVAELDGAGNVVARFVYGRDRNVPDLMVKGAATYRILTDHLGSPRLVVDSATGSVAQRMDFDEFGRVLVDTSPGFTPFGFAGGLYDADTGLVRFGARDYDPETGRWAAKDPLGFGGGDTNLYAYAGQDPINNIDPDGRIWWAVGGGVIGAGLDLGFQLLDNGGNFGCVNWASVGRSAIGGALMGAGIGALTGTSIAAATQGSMVTVSHWNTAANIAAGLRSGSWVMLGGATWRNWLLAGVAQQGYKYGNSLTTQVPAGSLVSPITREGWVLGSIKHVIGQRIYQP
ncbi:RHS repeat-associated core domain-containing protein [Sorangium sp. So ce834]|uniref:RHS repeat-associated core domain-containing protein n=1 Tax=Sorangium sp. So ce834 TaxID=3133321 RepID=UPI003F620AD1